MGSSVEIYVKYSGEGPGLAQRVARDLGVVSYFYSGLGYVLELDAQRFIGMARRLPASAPPEDVGQLLLSLVASARSQVTA